MTKKKKKPIDSEDDILDSKNNPVDSKSHQLFQAMIRLEVVSIEINYTGSGDDGGMESYSMKDSTGGEIENEQLLHIAEDFVYDKLAANFNNDGSSGEVTLFVEDMKLKMKGEHREYVMESNTTWSDEEGETLVDASVTL